VLITSPFPQPNAEERKGKKKRERERKKKKDCCPEAQSVSYSSTPALGSLSWSSHREALTHFIKLSGRQWS